MAFCLVVSVDVVISNYCRMRFLIFVDGQIRNQCCSYKMILRTGCSSFSLSIDIELRYRIILMMHLMNFYHRFLADDVFCDFGPWSERSEFTLSTEIDLSIYPFAFFVHHSLSLFFMYSNFFLNPISEFPFIKKLCTYNFNEITIIDRPEITSIKLVQKGLFINPLTGNLLISQT